MAFGVRKFSVRAQVMRRRDGSLSKVSIIPTRSMKKKGEEKAKAKLSPEQKSGKKPAKPKRKTRAPRS